MEPRSASEGGAHNTDQVESANKGAQCSGEDEYAQPVPLGQQAQPKFLSNKYFCLLYLLFYFLC